MLAVAGSLVAGCSSDADATHVDTSATPSRTALSPYVAERLTCDVDHASPEAQDVNEQVGGRAEDGFRVRFSRSTEVGIVALVTGDAALAFRRLHAEFGVAIVAPVEREDDPGRISSFAQVDALVDGVCGTSD